MDTFALPDFTTPYSRKWTAGTYEWPDIPYATQTRGCLRMSFDGEAAWWAESYRGDPLPLTWRELEPLVFSMMLANPCFRITKKSHNVKELLKLGDSYDGGTVTRANCEYRVLRYKEYDDGWREPIYSKKLTLIKGEPAIVEYREAV